MIRHKKNSTLKAEARESLLGNLTTAVISVLSYAFMYMFLRSTISNVTLSHTTAAIFYTLLTSFVTDVLLNLLKVGLCSQTMHFRFHRPAGISEIWTAFTVLGDRAVKVCACLSLLHTAVLLPSVIAANVLYTNNPQRDLAVILCAVLVAFVLRMYVQIRYAPAAFLLLDYPTLSAGNVLRLSAQLMKGNKRRLLSLWMSFLPLMLLGILSFGIGFLWIYCYLLASSAAFYCDLVLCRLSR